MEKCKVGDVVMIRDDLKEGICGNINIVPPMLRYSKLKARVIAIASCTGDADAAWLDITGTDYIWPAEALVQFKTNCHVNNKLLIKML